MNVMNTDTVTVLKALYNCKFDISSMVYCLSFFSPLSLLNYNSQGRKKMVVIVLALLIFSIWSTT